MYSSSSNSNRERRSEISRRMHKGITSGQRHRDHQSGNINQYSDGCAEIRPNFFAPGGQMMRSYNAAIMQFLIDRCMFQQASRTMQETQNYYQLLYRQDQAQAHYFNSPAAVLNRAMIAEGAPYAFYNQLLRAPVQVRENLSVPAFPISHLQRDSNALAPSQLHSYLSYNPWCSFWNSQQTAPLLRAVNPMSTRQQEPMGRTYYRNTKQWNNTIRKGSNKERKPPRLRQKQSSNQFQSHVRPAKTEQMKSEVMNSHHYDGNPLSKVEQPHKTQFNDETDIDLSQCMITSDDDKKSRAKRYADSKVGTASDENPNDFDSLGDRDYLCESSEALYSSNVSQLKDTLENENYRKHNYHIPPEKFSLYTGRDVCNKWEGCMQPGCVNSSDVTSEYLKNQGACNWHEHISQTHTNFVDSRNNYMENRSDNNPVRCSREWEILSSQMPCENSEKTWQGALRDFHSQSNEHSRPQEQSKISTDEEMLLEAHAKKSWNEPQESLNLQDIKMSFEKIIDNSSYGQNQDKLFEQNTHVHDPAMVYSEMNPFCDYIFVPLESPTIPPSDVFQMSEFISDIQKEQDEIVDSLRWQDYMHEQLMKFYQLINKQQSSD